MTGWKKTPLTVSGSPVAMDAADRLTWSLDAKEAVTLATSQLTRLDTGALFAAGIEATVLVGQIAGTTVSGLTEGVDYRLDVTFTNAAGQRWTGSLIVQCVS